MPKSCEWESESDSDYGITHSSTIFRVRRHNICIFCVGAVATMLGDMLEQNDLIPRL